MCTTIKPQYWILSLSGGKDSTALSIEWLKRNKSNPNDYPLDEVIFCDVGMDFPGMIKHINKLCGIFTEEKIKFTRLKSEKSFEYLMFNHSPNSNPNKQGFSWPDFQARWCTAILKTQVINNYIKELNKQYTVIQLIGLAADEEKRLEKANNQNPSHRHPLAEWGWSESECLQYCYDHGFDWGGLYDLFDRVSCWCCPLKSLPELRNLRKHFPHLWNKLLDMEHRTWRTFRHDYSVDQLDIRFQLEEERLANGLSIKTREFHNLLKQKLAESSVTRT